MDITLHPIIATWLSTLSIILTNYSLIGETDAPNDPLREAMRSYHAIVLAPLSQEIQDFLKSSSVSPMEQYVDYKNNLKNIALSPKFVQTQSEIRLQKYLLKANNLRAHFKLALCAESNALRKATPENFDEVQEASISILAGFANEIIQVDNEIHSHLIYMNKAILRIQKILRSYKRKSTKMIHCDQCGYKTVPTEIVKQCDQNICSTCFDDNFEGYDSY